MMSIKFLGLQLVKAAGVRRLTAPLTDDQQLYLEALGLSESDLIRPP
jgi:hypothetical protein